MTSEKSEAMTHPETNQSDTPAHNLDPSKPSTAAELDGATSDDPVDLADSADLTDSAPKVDSDTAPDDRQPHDKP